MNWYDFLVTMVQDMVDRYRRWFFSTFTLALLASLLTFIGVAWMFRLTHYGKEEFGPPLTLQHPILYVNNAWLPANYQYIDLSRIIWFFFLAIFALVIARLEQQSSRVGAERTKTNDLESGKPASVAVRKALSCIHDVDFLAILGLSFVSGIGDVLLVLTKNGMQKAFEHNIALSEFSTQILLLLRQLLPPLIMTSCLKWQLYKGNRTWSPKLWLSLIIAFWLLQVVLVNLGETVEYLGYMLPLAFFPEDAFFHAKMLVGSFLAIPVIACFFLAYGSVMVSAIRLVASSGKIKITRQSPAEDTASEATLPGT